MNLWTLDEVIAATGGRAVGVASSSFGSVSIDSREIESDALFVAIKGDRVDGHDYVARALEAGAAAEAAAGVAVSGPGAAEMNHRGQVLLLLERGRADPLAHLQLTTFAYREAAQVLHDLAHEVAGGRWVATGGGGYQWASVVPRAWTIYFAEMAGVDPPDRLPRSWLEQAELEAGVALPDELDDEVVDEES